MLNGRGLEGRKGWALMDGRKSAFLWLLLLALLVPALVSPALAEGEPTYSISGTVTATDGSPLAGVWVIARTADGTYSRGTRTSSDGTYTITGFAPGSYKIRTNDSGYVDEWYSNLPYQNDPSGTGATLVPLGTSNVTGIDFQLEMGYSISGTVTATDGSPLGDGVWVDLLTADGTFIRGIGIETDGTYSFTGLASGSYKIRANNSLGYLNEWYDNVLVQSDPFGAGATLVPLGTSNATGIDFQLDMGYSISGTVTAADGSPLTDDVWVALYTADGAFIRSVWMETDGTYSFTGLAPGSFKIHTGNYLGYVNEWYDDVIDQGDPTGIGATLVPLGTSNVTGIDFELDMSYSISGTVTAVGGSPLDGLWVALHTADGTFIRSNLTAPDGTYGFTGLLPGSYKLRTRNYLGYLDEWYDNVAAESDPSGAVATLVPLGTSNATGIDFQLERKGVISGTVTDTGSGPVASIEVRALPVLGGTTYWSGWTEADGTYTISNLDPGSYTVRTLNYHGWQDEWHDNLSCASDPTGAGAIVVEVATGTQAAIDFTLEVIDVTPPDTFFVAEDSPFYKMKQPGIRWYGSDDYGCEQVQYRFDGGDLASAQSYKIFPGFDLADGPHTAEAAAVDFVGNIDSTPATLDFVVDTVQPEYDWTLPVDQTNSTSRMVTFSGTAGDGLSGVAEVRIEVVCGSQSFIRLVTMDDDAQVLDYIYPGSSTWSADVVLPIGTCQARVCAVDAARNASVWSGWRTINVDVVDTEQPVTSIDALPWMWMKTLALSGDSTDDGGVDYVEYSTDAGANWSGVTGTQLQLDGSLAWFMNVSGLADGLYGVLVRSVDLSTKVGEAAQADVGIDHTSPELTWDAHVSGSILTVAGTLSDAGCGAGGVLVSFVTRQAGVVVDSGFTEITMDDDADIYDYIYPGSSSFSQDFTLMDGETTVKVRPHDGLGNYGAYETLVVTAPDHVSLGLAPGWNLVAGASGTIFPAGLFGWNGSAYTTSTDPVVWKGYWCKVAEPATVDLVTVPGPYTVVLSTGWNLIGNPMPTTATLTLPPMRPAFVWNSDEHTYESASSLQPGQGAWVRGIAGDEVVFTP